MGVNTLWGGFLIVGQFLVILGVFWVVFFGSRIREWGDCWMGRRLEAGGWREKSDFTTDGREDEA